MSADENNIETYKRALFLQACVFPGAGYLLIGKKLRGFIFIAATCYFVIMPFFKFSRTLFRLLMPSNPSEILNEKTIHAVSIAWKTHQNLMLISLAGIVLLWAAGAIDIWMMKNRDRRAAKTAARDDNMHS